jgi:Flp pilus assembly protein TadB
MPDAAVLAAAATVGVCCSTAVLASGRDLHVSTADALRALTRARPPGVNAVRAALELLIQRAGWHETPERVAGLAIVIAAGGAALGLSVAAMVAPAAAPALFVAGLGTGAAGVAYALQASAARRRERLNRELAPLLELFVLELSGGGSPLSALGSVTLQLQGELSGDIRALLIASQVGGTAPFETRLRELSERLQVPGLDSLATILTASREYGTRVTDGVRALAADLRRSQRRELIAHSRRALNHVLFPAAVGVLLPFLAILLYPAVSTLKANLR